MAVRRVKGVLEVNGNAKERTVTIQFDQEMAGIEDIKVAMDRIGYEAEEI